jgi:aminotransferase
MKELSCKVSIAPKSKIRELFDLASGRKDIISLGIGQPDFPTPDPAINGNIKALKKKITYYAPTRGIPSLLREIQLKLKKFNNVETKWDENLIVTNGGSQALNLAFATIFNPGDELILPSPNFISYFYCALFFDVKVVEVPRKADFSLNLEGIQKAISKKTKAILINSPNNPTGHVLSIEEVDGLVNLVLEHDLYLICDEVYENYTYEGLKHISPASKEEMFDRTITINAMSKFFAATGFRLGYVAANKEVIDLMEKYHQYTVAGTNHAAQFGFLEALRMDTTFFTPILKSFDERRVLVYDRLKELGFEVTKPRGSFYIMPSVVNFNMTGEDFSSKIMEECGVAVVPGNIFGSYSSDFIRISYATEKSKLIEALNRIQDVIKRW